MLRVLFFLVGAVVTGGLTFLVMEGQPYQGAVAFVAGLAGGVAGWLGSFLFRVVIRLLFSALVGAIVGGIVGFFLGVLFGANALVLARIGAALGVLVLLFTRGGHAIRSARASARGRPASASLSSPP